MLTSDTKRHIDAARQVLVGIVPDPKGQVDQITNALIYKFMDDMDQSAIKAGGKASFFVKDLERYSWTTLMSPKLGNQEKMNLYVEAIAKFGDAKQLPDLFRDIFKRAFLPYRDPETLALFLKEIAYFSYSHSEELGNAYEYLLSIMGSQGDAGQFRTPRHIIDFMVDVVDPGKEDTVLDPACGTAGFLISAYKHILAKHDGKDNATGKKTGAEKPLTPDERRKVTEHFTGYDISPDMVRMSQVNMYLHAFKKPKIYEYNTLASDDRWNEKFDVILANPPFMSPQGGVRPHNKFSVESSRAEVLFVDYIMTHLKSRGRGGIIVPEGVIFQSGSAYKQLRKLLIEDGLYAVVSLPSGVFNPYSAVKTSILFFDNQCAEKSKTILFVKIKNTGVDLGASKKEIDGSDLPEATRILKAHREAILQEKATPKSPVAFAVKKSLVEQNGEYNLSGDRYRVEENFAGAKWPMVSLEELVEERKDRVGSDSIEVWSVSNEKGFIKSTEYFSKQIASADIKNYKKIQKDDFAYNPSRINVGSIALNDSDAIGAVSPMYVVFNIVDLAKLSPKYLALLLKSDQLKESIVSLSQGAVRQQLRFKDLQQIKIPLPPVVVQNQIVNELAGHQKIVDGANEVVVNYRPSFKTDSSWKKSKLGDISEIEYGFGASAEKTGDTRIVRITDIGSDGQLIKDDAKYIDLSEESRPYLLKQGDVLVARTGATYGKTMIFDEKYQAVFASFLIRLKFDKSKILPEYYWVFAQTDDYWNQARSFVTGGAQPQFNGNVIKEILVPVPPIKSQGEIINQAKAELAHIESTKSVRKIFEQKITDRIAELFTQ